SPMSCWLGRSRRSHCAAVLPGLPHRSLRHAQTSCLRWWTSRSAHAGVNPQTMDRAKCLHALARGWSETNALADESSVSRSLTLQRLRALRRIFQRERCGCGIESIDHRRPDIVGNRGLRPLRIDQHAAARLTRRDITIGIAQGIVESECLLL